MKKYGFCSIIVLIMAMLISATAFAMSGEKEEKDNTLMLEIPTLRYRVHSDTGWGRYCWGDETAGSKGFDHPIDAFYLGMTGNDMLLVQYQVYTAEDGWSSWCRTGHSVGKAGSGQVIKGIKVMVNGRAKMFHKVYLQVYVTGKGWQPWVQDGLVAGDLENSIQAIRVKVD